MTSAVSSSSPILHLRAEAKPFEHRSCLSPAIVRALIASGYAVHVERSSTDPNYARIFADSEYADAGASLVPEGSWIDAPTDHLIIGLKELPEVDDDDDDDDNDNDGDNDKSKATKEKEKKFPIRHTMVHFAHCYKQQSGWETVLRRFARGGGVLYDLEFLEDAQGRRVAAFGFHAGFAGAALALKAWCWQFIHPESPSLPPVQDFTHGLGYYENVGELIQQLRTDMNHSAVREHTPPRVMVLGAKGRCGRGAVDLLKKAGVAEESVVQWDIEETKDRDGPYAEIVESDIFINTIYLTKKIPPFVTNETLNKASRKLRVICDVSCDPNSPNNPIPIYDRLTYFNNPTLLLNPPSCTIDSATTSSSTPSTTPPSTTPLAGPPLSIIAIDHLPSLLPREASEAFGKDLLPSLEKLRERKTASVWTRAEKLFWEKVGELPEKETKTKDTKTDTKEKEEGGG